MRNLTGMIGVLAASWLLVGCVPSTNIREPLTASPNTARSQPAPTNGAIFQSGVNDRPLFEDRRARRIGDIVTITIVETTAASGKSATALGNSGSIAVNTPLITGGVAGDSSLSGSSKNDASGSNTFTGTLTATVTDVLPNGNLRVAGEKQISIRYSDEYVRFSGVVSPADISGTNSVLSTKVADVHLEYKGATNLDGASVTSMFARIFTTVLPF
ncbi:MAG: flagellar basal body L-ring protein FlgH [Gammaproteobacteria bacterium]|nr:flagellar basal body L-ring protein FlgH [Sideroxydans sp.]MBU3904332.1 flagellar basal body L-ring protein FlgH [Gammaproteobacteria bacterium]MBU4046131.1 flagellar basal body L-ring protein FlgH [Gammaproteobacteria bacterium]MBU4150895.1 flagellar basal body L-ring protein FlgH [Gammaproteobacteria bacterium]